MNEVEDGVSREQYELLVEYCNLLMKWNKSINIFTPLCFKDLYSRHILDSLQLMRFINDKNVSIIDVGSGGGFPGLVLSICGIKKVTLIESTSKKAAFLLEASKILGQEVLIKNSRVEQENLECDILVSRAFANLTQIFKLTKGIRVRDKYLLHKGKSYKDEIQEAKKEVLFNVNIYNSITSSCGKILEIKK